MRVSKPLRQLTGLAAYYCVQLMEKWFAFISRFCRVERYLITFFEHILIEEHIVNIALIVVRSIKNNTGESTIDGYQCGRSVLPSMDLCITLLGRECRFSFLQQWNTPHRSIMWGNFRRRSKVKIEKFPPHFYLIKNSNRHRKTGDYGLTSRLYVVSLETGWRIHVKVAAWEWKRGETIGHCKLVWKTN